ncbi:MULTISPECIES: helix-turn-helix domain-containing protein [Paenibacillus]|uniref:Helix-turn-helix domain-containing protein n=1 Tax=Paenibacillus cucumis (ex Kampfer et al. 2016) TaxID=1776858 RepID=A0ABS7KFE9_9BACL|nr:helix-turn-helix domain-containing protein [Paenibacillus cucumis (ex Kampfer et al. 2016)]MBY0202662.1 helix-turn-helix domain-containing protein [Paenibacillus cucumis (ex Kampfer et al. 2016)]MDP9700300.1 transposase [Paenibacillus intestini]
MSITYSEKSLFNKNSNQIAKELAFRLGDYENSVLLFKVLAHSLRNNETLMQELDEEIFENHEAFQKGFEQLLQHALIVATDKDTKLVSPSGKKEIAEEYTPSQLAQFFGVSVMTIHNWLKQGRFIGVQKAAANKHNKIADDTAFRMTSGNVVTIRDVVDMWRKQENESITKEENNLEYYTRQISFYEEKYSGEFEQTLGTKSELTSEEETDAQVWQHLLGRQRLEFEDSEK